MMRKSKQAKACAESLWPVERGEEGLPNTLRS